MNFQLLLLISLEVLFEIAGLMSDLLHTYDQHQTHNIQAKQITMKFKFDKIKKK